MTAIRQLVLEQMICKTLRLAAAEAEALSLGDPVSDRDVLCSWITPDDE
jgi:hypothetical protein